MRVVSLAVCLSERKHREFSHLTIIIFGYGNDLVEIRLYTLSLYVFVCILNTRRPQKHPVRPSTIHSQVFIIIILYAFNTLIYIHFIIYIIILSTDLYLSIDLHL